MPAFLSSQEEEDPNAKFYYYTAIVQMFGRQWRISSDDFVCPGLTELLVRLAWLTVITALIALHLQETEYLKCLVSSLFILVMYFRPVVFFWYLG